MVIPLIDPEASETQTLDEIREWHKGIVEAIVTQRGSVTAAILNGSVVAQRFVGMTQTDIDDYFDNLRRELDRLTVLSLVASGEAAITIDYYRRVRGKLKDTLASAYRKWHKSLPRKKQLRPDFDQGGILEVMKRARIMDKNIIGRYRQCLRPRHWVGHGRFWQKPAEVDQFDLDEIYDRISALLNAIPK